MDIHKNGLTQFSGIFYSPKTFGIRWKLARFHFLRLKEHKLDGLSSKPAAGAKNFVFETNCKYAYFAKMHLFAICGASHHNRCVGRGQQHVQGRIQACGMCLWYQGPSYAHLRLNVALPQRPNSKWICNKTRSILHILRNDKLWPADTHRTPNVSKYCVCVI